MKAVKRIVIIGVCIVALLLAALLITPFFVDINTYKPEIEKRVSVYTGRPFRLGGDLKLTLFPWAGVTLSDLHLGNTAEFGNDDMLSIRSFEVRMKLLPLLSKKVEIKRFVVNEPYLALQKTKSGKGNWEGIGPSAAPKNGQPADKSKEQPADTPKKGLPISSFEMETFALENGTVVWQDRSAGVEKEIANLYFYLDDVTLEKPVGIRLSADVDKKPISLEGKVGPIGKEPGQGTITVDLGIKLFNQLNVSLNGKVTNPVSGASFDFLVDIPEFSPRKLADTAGIKFPVQTTDPQALNRFALKTRISGDKGRVSATNGNIILDDSSADFTLTAKEFTKPNIAFTMKLDHINVDRYLPPKGESSKAADPQTSKSVPKEQKKAAGSDYTLLRKLILQGEITIGQMVAAKATMADIIVKIVAKNGVFTIDPASLELYEGGMITKSVIDFRKSKPAVTADLDIKNVQIGPLVKDLMDRDIIEGTTEALIHLTFTGESAPEIKKNLSGNGNFVCVDGALKGIDLEAMMHNTAAAFGLGTQTQHKPQTIFSTLDSQFTINNGLLDNPKTSMISERLRVMANGKADIVQETLNFRIEPKYIEKSEDAAKEIVVPVLVGGTFDSPKFFPDVKSALQQEYMQSPEMKEKLKKLGIEEKEQKIIEDVSDQILKGLNLGN